MKKVMMCMLLVGVFVLPLSSMAVEKEYVTIDDIEYLRCQPVKDYSGDADGVTGDAGEWWLIIMNPAASWNKPDCVARGDELIFENLVPVKNAVCNNDVGDARRLIEGTGTPSAISEVETLVITEDQSASITTNPDGDNYTVTICGFDLEYLEMYRHDKVSPKKRFHKDDLEELKKGCGYEITLPAGHGYNFEYVSPVDGNSQWLSFTGYGKDSWQGNGTCTMPVVWGSASTKGAEIVACSDPLFQTLLQRSNEIVKEHAGRGILFVP